MQPDILEVLVAFDPPRHAVVRLFVYLMFDELLFVALFSSIIIFKEVNFVNRGVDR